MNSISRLEKLRLAMKSLGLEPLSAPKGKLGRASEALKKLESQNPLPVDGLTMIEKEAKRRGLSLHGEDQSDPTESVAQ